MEFTSPKHKQRFLAPADRFKATTRGVIATEPGGIAISKTKDRHAKRGSPGFNNSRLQFPKLRIQSRLKEEKRMPFRVAGLEVKAEVGAHLATKYGSDTRDRHASENPTEVL